MEWKVHNTVLTFDLLIVPCVPSDVVWVFDMCFGIVILSRKRHHKVFATRAVTHAIIQSLRVRVEEGIFAKYQVF